MASATEVFVEAIGRSPGERDAFVSLRCAGHSGLSDEVRSLLAHHEQSDSFLVSGIARARRALLADPRSQISGIHRLRDYSAFDELCGQRIGGYTILRGIGHGGMGAVYLAEQNQPRRTVAIKLIRRGVLSRGAQRRFADEAEALGRLQHPGIAQIYEAGSECVGFLNRESIPFIAMEYVAGRSLTDYVAAVRPSPRQIVKLMMQVGQAVHHAHQRGVIHRDLKPANILVVAAGTHSPSPQPKILDFGVARFSDAERTATQLTGDGQFIGTLAYMSPEQVSGSTRDVDTRCDVYALGVILYQLLAGRLPIDPAERSVPDVVRAICEHSPVRLGALHREFRGDLETIVARAMEKDRERRYSSAGDMAEDLRRFLAGEAIEARRDSTLYVLHRGLRRHRGLVAGAASAALALAGFAGYATIEAGRLAQLSASESAARQREAAAAEAAREAAASAASEAEKARRASSFLSAVINSASPGSVSGYDRTVIDVLDDASRQLSAGALAGGTDVEAEVRRTLAQTYTRLFLHDAAMVHHAWLLDYYEQRFGLHSAEYIETLARLCDAWNELGLLDRSEAELRRALGLARETFGPESHEALHMADLLGNCLMRKGDSAAALQLNQEAVDGLACITGDDSVATAEARFNLAGAYRGLRCRAEMSALYEQARPILEDLPHDPVGAVRFRRFYVRDVLLRGGQPEAAERAFRSVLAFATEKLGADHPETLGAATFLGHCLRTREKTDEAVALLRNAVEVFTRIRNSIPGGESQTVLELAVCHLVRSERDAARDLIRAELERCSSICGALDARSMRFLKQAAELLRERGERMLALEFFDELSARGESAFGLGDPRVKEWRSACAALRSPAAQ